MDQRRKLLWYWLLVRLAYGLAYFSFFYCLHRRGVEYGVYPIKLAPWQQTLFGLLFGQDALLGTCHHDAHHQQPRVSAYHLPGSGFVTGGDLRPAAFLSKIPAFVGR